MAERLLFILAAVVVSLSGCRADQREVAPASPGTWPSFDQIVAGMEGERGEGDRFWVLSCTDMAVTAMKDHSAILFRWDPNPERMLDPDYAEVLNRLSRNRARFFANVMPEWDGASTTMGFLTTRSDGLLTIPHNQYWIEISPGGAMMLLLTPRTESER